MIGLSDAVPRCAVNIRLDCSIEGVGVDPDRPPLAWEAYDGESWVECEVDKDTTGGFNRAGDIVVHVPASHAAALDHQVRAGWLRARVTTPEKGQPFYSDSPLIKKVEAFTIGGTVEAVQAQVIEEENPRSVRGRARASAFLSPELPSSPPEKLWCWRCRARTAGRTGRPCPTSPRADQRTVTSCSTRSPARCCSGQQSAPPTGRYASTARCQPRVRCCACASTTPAVASRAMWPRGPSACPDHHPLRLAG